MTTNHDEPVERTLRITRASDVEPRPVRWLLHHLIPRAALTLLAGREGLGKSTMWSMWAADITHGRMPGDLAGTPADVLVIANEDSREHTLHPRLAAAGANLDRVHFVDALTLTGSSSVVLPIDTKRLADVIRQTGAVLVVVDPLTSTLDGRLDSHKDHSIRQALDPLNHLASTTGASILGLVHLNKGQGTDVLDRVLGSRAFTAAARAVLTMAPDPDDDTGRQVLVFQSKSNLGPRTREALVVTVEPATVDTTEGPTEVGRAVIVTRRDVDPHDIMRPTDQDDAEETSDAGRWLLDFLVEHGGEAAHLDVRDSARRAGHSLDQVKRAATRLGVERRRTSGFPSSTIWHYPQSEHLAHSVQSEVTPTDSAPTAEPHSEHSTVVTPPTALTAPTAPTVPVIHARRKR
jgi:hypothetical protein